MKDLRHQARETRDRTADIINGATGGLPEAVSVQMPSRPNLKRTVQRIRQDGDIPPQPRTLAELDIPDDFLRLQNGDQFVMHDSGPETGNER